MNIAYQLQPSMAFPLHLAPCTLPPCNSTIIQRIPHQIDKHGNDVSDRGSISSDPIWPHRCHRYSPSDPLITLTNQKDGKAGNSLIWAERRREKVRVVRCSLSRSVLLFRRYFRSSRVYDSGTSILHYQRSRSTDRELLLTPSPSSSIGYHAQNDSCEESSSVHQNRDALALTLEWAALPCSCQW